MSAIPEDFVQQALKLSEEITKPFPNSKKVYVQGSRPDLRVGMREVECAPTTTQGLNEDNPPITIYDTSGPLHLQPSFRNIY